MSDIKPTIHVYQSVTPNVPEFIAFFYDLRPLNMERRALPRHTSAKTREECEQAAIDMLDDMKRKREMASENPTTGLAGKIWIYNTKTGERLRIDPNLMQVYEISGWIKKGPRSA